jgi:ABC-type multidrug transport system fused ATPase/permease subunit
VLGIVLLTALIELARDYLVAWVLGRIDLDMKVEVCGSCWRCRCASTAIADRGDLLARLHGRRRHRAGRARARVRRLRARRVMLPLGAASLLVVSWQLSLVMLLLGPAIFSTISLFGRRIRRSAHRRQREFADVTGA